MIFCGIPGSGKTTIALLVAGGLCPAVHIQTDGIRSMINRPSYSWAEARFVYESAFLVAREALRRGYDSILDGTFLREEHRREAIRKLGWYSSSSLVVWVSCDIETARKRNISRGVAVPQDSFERLSGRFERPNKGLVLDTKTTGPDAAAKVVLSRLARSGGRETGATEGSSHGR